MSLRLLVERTFNEPGSCLHCEERSKLRFLRGGDKLTACQVCPSGYVSRIIAYGLDVDILSFKIFIVKILDGHGDVEEQDIRIATRYAWDVGVAGNPEIVMRETYWNQNYRRTKNDDPNRVGLYLCTKCTSFFFQPVSSHRTLCDKCRLQS